jgi:hypothetical protein
MHAIYGLRVRPHGYQAALHDFNSLITELFNVFDADQNGHISRDEVKHLFAAADKMMGRVTDVQASRCIHVVIIPFTSLPIQRANAFFNIVDSNNDGKLTCDEFVQHARSDASIMNVGETFLYNHAKCACHPQHAFLLAGPPGNTVHHTWHVLLGLEPSAHRIGCSSK